MTRRSGADAVLVFAGGDGERQAEGARLVRSGVAPVLVVSNGGDTTSPSARACKPAQDLEVTCLTPPSSSTRSEARAFAGLAERQHWGSVVVVTTTYHLRRARQALRRCYDGAVASVAVAPAGHLWDLPRHIAREWAGLVVTRHGPAGMLMPVRFRPAGRRSGRRPPRRRRG